MKTKRPDMLGNQFAKGKGKKCSSNCTCGKHHGTRAKQLKGNKLKFKGDGAQPRTIAYRGYKKARKKFLLPDECERCDNPAQVRHHKDRNTNNNRRSNIEFLCRACHAREHHKNG